MSQYRDNLVEIREAVFRDLAEMRRLGDYGAGASHIREMGEALLKLLDLMLERAR